MSGNGNGGYGVANFGIGVRMRGSGLEVWGLGCGGGDEGMEFVDGGSGCRVQGWRIGGWG